LESCKEDNGTLLETFTIIATDPNEVMEPLHDRMPVIIEPKTTTAGSSRRKLRLCLLIC